MTLTSLLVAGMVASQAPALLAPIPDATPVHVSVALRLGHPRELDAFRRGQHDSNSPDYQRTLTPREFGERFGPSAQTYAKVSAWLREAGFAVTEFPNRILIEGTGTAAQVTKLLGIHLQGVEGQPASMHSPDGTPRLPPALAPFILHVSGLDTRVRYRHHLAVGEVPSER